MCRAYMGAFAGSNLTGAVGLDTSRSAEQSYTGTQALACALQAGSGALDTMLPRPWRCRGPGMTLW